MNYSKLKDHEINAAVGETMGWNAKFIHQDDSVTFRDDLGRLRGRKNYCKSWADAGPIVDANKIAMIPEADGTWFALGHPQIKNNWRVESTGAFHNDTTPLRAAMIVFLMMQEKPNA